MEFLLILTTLFSILIILLKIINQLSPEQRINKIKQKKGIEGIIKTLKHKNSKLREAAKRSLLNTKNESELKKLRNALEDEDWFVRKTVVEILGEINNASTIEFLIEALGDNNSFIRYYIAKRAILKKQDYNVIIHLINALKNKNVLIRESAAEILGEIGDVQAIKPLIELLKDENKSIRYIAKKSILKLRNTKDIERLFNALKDDNISVRKAAKVVLIRIKEQLEFDEIIKALRDPKSYFEAREILSSYIDRDKIEECILALKDKKWIVRKTAAELLGELKDIRAVTPLIESMNDPKSDVRYASLEALKKIIFTYFKTSQTNKAHNENFEQHDILSRSFKETTLQNLIEQLIEALKNKVEDEFIRIGIIKILKEINAVNVKDLLIELLLKDKSSLVRSEAALTLGKLKDNRALKTLIEATKYKEIRASVAEALGEFKNVNALETLLNLLNDKSAIVRKKTVEAIVKIRDIRALEYLINCLTDNDLDVRNTAEDALLSFKDKNAITIFIKKLNEPNHYIREVLVRALANIGDRSLTELLVDLLKDERFHSLVINTLDKINPNWAKNYRIKERFKEYLSMLSHDKLCVRLAAIETLGKIGDARAVEPLIELTNEKNVNIRQAVIRALGNIGDIRAIETIIKSLNDESEDVRFEAVKALGRIKSSYVMEPLFNALKDREYSVRKEALRSIERINPNWRESKIYNKIFQELVNSLRNDEDIERINSINALGELRDIRAFEHLIELLDESDYETRIKSMYALIKIGDVRSISKIIYTLNDIYYDDPGYWLEDLFLIENELFELTKKFNNSFFHFLCTKHFLRVERITDFIEYNYLKNFSEEMDRYTSITYIACRGCADTLFLVPNIKQVIGVIGGYIYNFEQDGDNIYVNLWYKGQARNADIDILEIRNSPNIDNFDTVINSVILKLYNDVSRDCNYLKNIPVIIRGSPSISEETKNMLIGNFKELKYEESISDLLW